MWASTIRPGRPYDQTAVRTEGIDDLLDAYPGVKFLVDAGHRGLAKDPRPGRRPTAKIEKGRPT
jgi:hypothetical protein